MKRRPFRYMGGKDRLAGAIIGMMPEHSVYTEAFGGGGSVLLQKPRSATEVYNDLYGDVVNAFRQLRDNAAELERRMRLTPFSREEYDRAYDATDDECEAARRFIFRAAAGFGSDSMNRRNGFRTGLNQNFTSGAGAWANLADAVPDIAARLRGVVIENRPAVQVLQQWDGPRRLHYVDPPYVHDTRRRVRHGYAHEMGDGDHVELAEVLHSLDGMVMLSGYHSDLYDDLYKGWRRVEMAARDNVNGARTEVLWFSPNVPDELPLFGKEFHGVA